MQFRLSTLLLLFVVLWSSLAVFGPLGVLAFAILLLLAIAVARSWMVLFWSVALLVLVAAVLLPAVANCRPAARRIQCNNNLKQIALALHDYEKANGCYPPAYIADKNGRPVHSWRVLLLPYLGYDSLYNQYSFNEPWDGPNNSKLLAARPREYVCPSDARAYSPDAAPTSYVAVVGPKAAWTGEKPRKAADLTPSSETIMLVEVADAGISWTEPKDLLVTALETAGTCPSTVTVSSQHGNRSGFLYTYRIGTGANVAFADGSVQYIEPESLPPHLLRKYLTIGGCKKDALDAADYSRRPPPEEPQLNWGNLIALAVWLVSVSLLFIRAVRSRKPNRGVANSSP
jgi:prepilin-type processing-associated H-X9-DG protein